jgi:hypothetical protein
MAPPLRAAARGCVMVDGSLTGLCLSGLRGPHQRLRLAHDERAALRPLRSPGLRQPLPADTRPPDPADERLAMAGEADGRGARRGPRLDLSWLASRGARRATRRARGRPSGAARPRRRAATGAAWCSLRELQRAQGLGPAAAVRLDGSEAPQQSRPRRNGTLEAPGLVATFLAHRSLAFHASRSRCIFPLANANSGVFGWRSLGL